MRAYGKPTANNGSQFHSVNDHGKWAPKRMPKRDATELRDAKRYARSLPHIDTDDVTECHSPAVYNSTLTRTERRNRRAARHNARMAYLADMGSR